MAAQRATASNPPARLGLRAWRMVTQWWRDHARGNFHRKALLATVPILAIGLAFVPGVVRQARATAYVDAAVATHRSCLNGDLPLEVRSDSPQEVTEWFAGKLPFHFQLPASRPGIGGKPDYRITGASTVHYNGGPAALVTYERQNVKVSLLAASAELAVVSGGLEVQAGRLIFHYWTRQELRVVTWSSHGVSYALVAPSSSSAPESCLVCHQDMADRRSFEHRP
jgi:anti-sigma factor RsiW